jgi:hypothetical protein
MRFPRTHLFVDANCPALVSGKLSTWAKPATLVSVIGHRNQQLSPPGAAAALAMHSWRTRHDPEQAVVQVLIEGGLSMNLMLALGESIVSTIVFADMEQIEQAETFAELVDYASDFEASVRGAQAAYESFLETLFHLNPSSDCYDGDILEEVEAMTTSDQPSRLLEALDQLAENLCSQNHPTEIASHKAA